MIETKIEIDRVTQARMEKVLRDFAATTGKTVEESIKRMAKSACKRLAETVQPYGMGGGKLGSKNLDKFMGSIAKQVVRAVRNANIEGNAATAAAAHRSRRDRSGQVPRDLKTQGRFNQSPIAFSDVDRQIKKAQSKAFLSKAAWVKAGDELGKPKMAKVDRRIRKNIPNAPGGFTSSGKDIETKITIFNHVPYADRIQSNSDVKASAMEGMKNGLAYMQTTTKKTIEKANREMQ